MSREQVSYYLLFTGIFILAASLSLSNFGMSISQAFLGAGWLLSSNFSEKFKKLKTSKAALLLISVYLLHIIGLLWTADFTYAMKDLRIKLPLFVIPFIMATIPPLKSGHFNKILKLIIAGVFVSTLISFAVYLGIIKREVIDIRDISIFISHIRLSLLITVSIILSGWLWYKDSDKKLSIVYLFLTGWFIYFLSLIESVTGFAILFVLMISGLIFLVVRIRTISLRYIVVATIGVMILSSLWYLKKVNDEVCASPAIDFTSLDKTTVNGNAYSNDPVAGTYENGNYIWMYVCEQELEYEWGKVSSMPIHGNDKRGQSLNVTLIRYMASKGLRKDSAGFSSLSSDDINSIEGGVANYKYNHPGLIGARLHQIFWEINRYHKGGDPSGHSVAQRLEYWRAAIAIIKAEPFIGVGTGDPPGAFSLQYKKMNSRLSDKWRLRAHNQYLSFAVAFGIPGMIWFVFVLWYLCGVAIRQRNFLFISFFIVALLSMLTEDTLETQAGITFFSFFSSLFLFTYPTAEDR